MSGRVAVESAAEYRSGPEPHTLGMLVFISSEATFFLFLLIAFISYQGRNVRGPTAAQTLNVGRTAIFSACLFASSLSLWLAERRLERRDRTGFHLLMGLTILLGLAFIGGQAWEYTDLVNSKLTLARDLFGSTFFTLTGFHGLHVIIGLILLSIATTLSYIGSIDDVRNPTLRSIVYYWHFVDGVWVVIFCTVYLWAALS